MSQSSTSCYSSKESLLPLQEKIIIYRHFAPFYQLNSAKIIHMCTSGGGIPTPEVIELQRDRLLLYF